MICGRQGYGDGVYADYHQFWRSTISRDPPPLPETITLLTCTAYILNCMFQLQDVHPTPLRLLHRTELQCSELNCTTDAYSTIPCLHLLLFCRLKGKRDSRNGAMELTIVWHCGYFEIFQPFSIALCSVAEHFKAVH